MKALATFFIAVAIGPVALANHLVSTSFYPERQVVSVRSTVSDLTVENVVENSFDQVYAQIEYSGLFATGEAFVRYHSDTDLPYYVVEVGVPVSGFTASVPLSMRSRLPGGRVATTVHTGSEASLPLAYAAIDRFMWFNNRVARGGAWEVYPEVGNYIRVVQPISIGVPGPAPAAP